MNDTKHHIQEQLNIGPNDAGQRVDLFLTQRYPEYSRATWQQWIKEGHVKINGHDTKSKTLLKGFEIVDIDVTLAQAVDDQPEPMDLDIRYQDDHLLVLNKPAGLVVHPGSGNPNGTLLNGLLALNEAQAMLPRAGIVHRLDKDTSGLMVVAKTLECQNRLIDLLKDHNVKRQYICIVKGQLKQEGTVDANISRHKTQRVKMAVNFDGKRAVTHYQPLEVFDHFTCVQVHLETGRTHQIRVHMHHLGHPLVGDPLYGNPNRIDPKVDDELKPLIRGFPRQALHAQQLSFMHPITDEAISVTAEQPDDLCHLLSELEFLDMKNDEFDEMEVEYCE